jgi:glycosyltransferase involved in cell wall biosynthesis
LFYPAFPRVFKNFEVIFEASMILESEGFDDFEIWLTIDTSINHYARKLTSKYPNVKAVRCIGALPREQVFRKYGEADCLLFPSKLETWGVPITEFKMTGKPILAADLPYAHETVGDYDAVDFFSPSDSSQLAQLIRGAATGSHVFGKSKAADIAPPFARNWEELWSVLLNENSH